MKTRVLYTAMSAGLLTSAFAISLVANAGVHANVHICVKQTTPSTDPSQQTKYFVDASNPHCNYNMPNPVTITVNNSDVGMLVCVDAGRMETKHSSSGGGYLLYRRSLFLFKY